MPNHYSCLVCGGNDISSLLDFGDQPVCNQFLQQASDAFSTANLHLGICETCGQIQLLDIPDVDRLRSPHKWIKYIEPEGHLDALVEMISDLNLIHEGAVIGGVTYKDLSTIDRLEGKHRLETWILDPVEDLGCKHPNSGVESYARAFNKEQLSKVTKPKADLLIVRHIYEHSPNPREALVALSSLITEQGCIVLEVPDSTRWLEVEEYTMTWEEHVTYFTPSMFRRALINMGMDVVFLESYPYSTEDSLVAIVRPANCRAPLQNAIPSDFYLARKYASHFENRKQALRGCLERIREQFGKIAVFGAGHMSMKFINFFQIADLIEFVIDDSENKCGTYLPYTGLRVAPSTDIEEYDISLVIMGLSTESQERVMRHQSERVNRGVRFASVSPVGPYALDPILTDIQNQFCDKQGNPVLYLNPDKPGIRLSEVNELALNVDQTPFFRNRICAHANDEDPLHEMMIVLSRNTYIPPHKHLDGAESLHVISGIAYLMKFDDDGNLREVVALGPPDSGYQFYYRLSSPVFHSFLIKSEQFIFHETKLGPFEPSNTIAADWAPDKQGDAARAWVARMDAMAQAKNEWK